MPAIISYYSTLDRLLLLAMCYIVSSHVNLLPDC